MLIFHILWQTHNENFLISNTDINEIEKKDRAINLFLYGFWIINFQIYSNQFILIEILIKPNKIQRIIIVTLLYIFTTGLFAYVIIVLGKWVTFMFFATF